MKKMKSRSFRILMAAVISAAMLCPQVKISAADGLVSKAVTSYFPSKTVMKKTARKTVRIPLPFTISPSCNVRLIPDLAFLQKIP